jgi:hypothetical protein
VKIVALRLVMGDDTKCLWCQRPQLFVGRGHARMPEIPWDLCPTHFGALTDDPEIRKLAEGVEV